MTEQATEAGPGLVQASFAAAVPTAAAALLEDAAAARWPEIVRAAAVLTAPTDVPLDADALVASIAAFVAAQADDADASVTLKIDVRDGQAAMRALMAPALLAAPVAARIGQILLELHVCDFVTSHDNLVRLWDAFVPALADADFLLTHKEVNLGAITPASTEIVRWEEHCHWSLVFLHADLHS